MCIERVRGMVKAVVDKEIKKLKKKRRKLKLEIKFWEWIGMASVSSWNKCDLDPVVVNRGNLGFYKTDEYRLDSQAGGIEIHREGKWYGFFSMGFWAPAEYAEEYFEISSSRIIGTES